jgi:hypothetical protein
MVPSMESFFDRMVDPIKFVSGQNITIAYHLLFFAIHE